MMANPENRGKEKSLAEILEEEYLRDLWIERVFMKPSKRRRKCQIRLKKKQKKSLKN